MSIKGFKLLDGNTDQYDYNYLANKPNSVVEDVEINGSSVVTDGVADIPIAGYQVLGAVSTNMDYGITANATSGRLTINKASDDQIKAGSGGYKPIVPDNQHTSAFYGLAKAAGDATQLASLNTVGTYTEEAKKAIRKMLGIPNTQGELIADITTEEDLTELYVTTDVNGLPFKLSKIIAIFTAPPSTTGTKDYFYNLVSYVNDSNVEATTSVPSYSYPTATSQQMSRSEVTANPGMPITCWSISASSEGNSQYPNIMAKPYIAKYFTGFRVYQSGSTKSLIPSGATLKLYGIRYDD